MARKKSSPSAKGTGEKPLELAEKLTALVNAAFESGAMLEKVTPTTRDLLRYWFSPTFTDARHVNFHAGQKQAILNTIFVHEVLHSQSVFDTYNAVDEHLLAEMGLAHIQGAKYEYPKYCLKMATGTGKTWVMHALLVWQYLNAKHEDVVSGSYSKNFLIVAPGLIVYERLLDAYLGKEQAASQAGDQDEGLRDFSTSDLHRFQDLFLPDSYRQEVFGFVQNNVMKKDDIGKAHGDGFIAVTNWHVLAEETVDVECEDDDIDPFANPAAIVKDMVPILPGKTAGHDLNALDRRYFSGTELEFLTKLADIVVFNDEAHHIHEIKKDGMVTEVEWQKSLERIASTKGKCFIQVDFSATPYNVTGSNQNQIKHYFPHVVTDFDLKTAIHQGLVKAIAIDKRKELASQDLAALDFKVERGPDGKALALSEGQKVMLNAGLSKLRLLEKGFVSHTAHDTQQKYPKMLVMCEDTEVSPLVVDYLLLQGLSEGDVVQIDSNKKGEIKPDEWLTLKRKLFGIDALASPKVVVSVLMLREGFDVNNICVIVPLRSSQAPILLEQTVGRGLRLMWREEVYAETKAHDRELMFKKKQEPTSYLDILSIIEHPAFMDFYDNLFKELIVEDTGEKEKVTGDIIEVGLKDDYAEYDLFFPVIIQDKEELLLDEAITPEKLTAYTQFSLAKLKKITSNSGNIFYSHEVTVNTKFGDYKVHEEAFTATSYNEFIARILASLGNALVRTGLRRKEQFPFMQINTANLARTLDEFIRHNLFGQVFEPFEDDNWRVLLLKESGIVEHIIREMSQAIYDMQNNVHVNEAIVQQYYFSSIENMKMRENYCVDVVKAIYPKLPYPSNKGIFEKEFMEFVDADSIVQRFIKIRENIHNFAYINYIRKDGIIARYFPDFMVKLDKDIYLVETKAEKDTDNSNVLSKKRSALTFVRKINELKDADRMDCAWHYVILSDSLFQTYRANGANTKEMLDFAKIKHKDTVEGQLLLTDL